MNKLMFTAATAAMLFACGSEKITERTTVKEVVVTKVVFVCADQSQVEDPRTCPPGPVEEKTVYVCHDGWVVEQWDACPTFCRVGWAWDEYAGQCRKVCPEGQYVSSDNDGVICGGGGGCDVVCKSIPTCESWQFLDPRTMTCVRPQRPTAILTQSGSRQWTAYPGDRTVFAEVKAWGTGNIEIMQIDMQIFVSDMSGNAIYPDAGGLVDLTQPCTISETGASPEFTGVPWVERDGAITTRINLAALSGVRVGQNGRTFLVSCVIREDIPIPAEGVRLVGVLETFWSRATTDGGDLDTWMWERNPQLDQYGMIFPHP